MEALIQCIHKLILMIPQGPLNHNQNMAENISGVITLLLLFPCLGTVINVEILVSFTAEQNHFSLGRKMVQNLSISLSMSISLYVHLSLCLHLSQSLVSIYSLPERGKQNLSPKEEAAEERELERVTFSSLEQNSHFLSQERTLFTSTSHPKLLLSLFH